MADKKRGGAQGPLPRSVMAASGERDICEQPLPAPFPVLPPGSPAAADGTADPHASLPSEASALAPGELVGPMQGLTVTLSHGGSVRPDMDFGASFFAGVMRWDCDTLASKLVDYVAASYAAPKRAAFRTIVHDCSEAHDIDGASVVRCLDLTETAAYLLGE